MKAIFVESFLIDVKKVRDRRVRRAVAGAIANVEEAETSREIRSLKRLSGQTDYYRIRIGDWRVGLSIKGDRATFIRCLHRREIYRYFP